MESVLLFTQNGKVGARLYELMIKKNFKIFTKDRMHCDLPLDEVVDACIYTAGVTSERNATAVQYVVDNCYAAVKTIEQCKTHGVKKIIFLSSDEVYGDLRSEALSIESPKISPNVYAMSKLLSEAVIKESGIQYFILRIPGVVGGSTSGKTFLERTVKKFFEGKDVFCYNEQYLFNNAVDLDDLCNFIIFLTEKELCGNKIFHLGQTDKVKLLDILLYIKKKTKSSSAIRPMPCSGRWFTLPTEEAEAVGYHSKGIFNILDEIISNMNSQKGD